VDRQKSRQKQSDFFERKMKQEISSFIFRWKGYLKTNKPETAANLKSDIEKTKARHALQNNVILFDHHFAEMQYEKGVKIVFD
jgi:hypothetical protein